MSDASTTGGRPAAVGWPARSGVGIDPPDARRLLQLALAGVWLLDAVLQYQSFMFSKGFGQMLAATAPGNPRIIASPITWDASLIEHHMILLNAIFATIQLVIAVGIAWRPTARIALAASIAWALGVWWFGEGLGDVLTGTSSPLTGAPGAVLIYALIAVLVWPADRDPAAPFVAARAVGLTAARAIWLVFWAGMTYLMLQPGNLTANGLPAMISGMTSGEPSWLARIENNAAAAMAHDGVAWSVVFAVAFAVIGLSILAPPGLARAGIVLAVLVAAFIWLVGEALGGILTGGGTDPNSGPLLALLALTYWPALGTAGRLAGPAAAAQPAAAAPGLTES